MKNVSIVLLLAIVAFFAHAKLKQKPSAIECSIAYEYYDGDILVSLIQKDLAKEEYKAANNNKELSRTTLGIIIMKETLKFQSKNTLLKFSNFLSCEPDYTVIKKKLNKIKGK